MTDLQEGRLSWVTDDTALSGRLDSLWPDWDSTGDSGLAAMLDQEWLSWDEWSVDDKRFRLAELLDRWYPPEPVQEEPAVPGVAEGSSADRVAWIRDDPGLLARLNAVWPGWDAPDGLVAVLDQTPEWDRWDEWSIDDKRSYLGQTLDAWYPPEPAAEASAVEPTPSPEQVTEMIDDALRAAIESTPGAEDLTDEDLAEIAAEVQAEVMGGDQ